MATYTTPGTYTITVPATAVSALVTIIGGGGGGGGQWGNGDNHAGGAGGSGGYYQNETINVTPGETLTIVVGAGGASASANFNGGQYCTGTAGAGSYNGTAGSASSIRRGATVLLTATGGNPGTGSGPGNNCSGQSGAGGSPNGQPGGSINCNRNSYSATLGGNNGFTYGRGGNGNGPPGSSVCPQTGGNGFASIDWFLGTPTPTCSLADIQQVFGGGNPISLSEYYRGVNASVPTETPASGTIAISNLRGRTVRPAAPFRFAVFSTPGTYTWVVPSTASNIIDLVSIGGGGGGSGRGGDNGDNGSGGYPGSFSSQSLNSLAIGTVITVVVGSGGAGGVGTYSSSNTMNPAAYGRAGTASYIMINGNMSVYAAGGAQNTADSPGNGYGVWYRDSSGAYTQNPAVANSWYTTYYGVNTYGASCETCNGSPGIYGGAGGPGCKPEVAGPPDSEGRPTTTSGYGNGGAGGGGFVRIKY